MHRWLGDASAEMRADLPKVHSLASFEMIEIDSPPPSSTWTFVQTIPKLASVLWQCRYKMPHRHSETTCSDAGDCPSGNGALITFSYLCQVFSGGKDTQLAIFPFHAQARNATPESSSDQSQILPVFGQKASIYIAQVESLEDDVIDAEPDAQAKLIIR